MEGKTVRLESQTAADSFLARLTDSLSACRAVFANPNLRRLLLGWGAWYAVEWSYTVAMSVFAYQQGGAAAVGVVGVLRVLPVAVAAPFGSWLGDRFRRDRILTFIHLARGLVLLASALIVLAGVADVVIYVLAVLFTIVSAPFRAVHWAILPSLAERPEELTASNLVASMIAGLGTLAGPALSGVLLATWGPGVVFTVMAVISGASAILVSRVTSVRRAHPVSRAAAVRVLPELLAGFRVLTTEPTSRLMMGLFASQTFVRGALTVLVVVSALDLLHTGRSGVGFLYSAMGAGGFLGVVTTLTLVQRRRLAAPFGLGLVLWGAPIAVVGLVPLPWLALVMLAAVGIGNTLEDVSGFTLLQRTVPDRFLARLFGVFESVISTAVSLGSLVAPVLVALLKIRGALAVTGAILPILVLVFWRSLREIDATTAVPVRQLGLLRGISLFAPLPIVTLERLARRLVPMKFAAGTDIVRQGDTGDRFYMLAQGEVEALIDGRPASRLTTGDFFGEIALLRDVLRTATVRAVTDVEVYALDREEFIAAVTGHSASAEAAESVISSRLAARGQP